MIVKLYTNECINEYFEKINNYYMCMYICILICLYGWLERDGGPAVRFSFKVLLT